MASFCSQLKKTAEELNDALATKEEIAQRCRELDMQVGFYAVVIPTCFNLLDLWFCTSEQGEQLLCHMS